MTCGAEGALDTSQIRGSERIGQGEFGNGVMMGGALTGEMELTLQVLLGDLQVAHGHTDIFVPQQLHESRKTDPQAEHFCGEGMTKLVAGYRRGASGSLGSLP
jgi:hypothetical protein